MRQKKIRGHKRRWKDVERWRLDNLDVNVPDILINGRGRYYAKIRVHPWSGISITNSEIPQPASKTQRKILRALFDIYNAWKEQLDRVEQPYYLKVWLFHPRFSQSQVVCAIGDNIDFYQKTFFSPEIHKNLSPDHYGDLKDEIETFSWSHYLDEDHYDNTEVGKPEVYASRQDYEDTRIWFEHLLKKPHRTTRFQQPVGDATESYSFRRGDVWIGEQK